MALSMSNARLANGTQRPEVVCSQLKTGTNMHSVALDWQNEAAIESHSISMPIALPTRATRFRGMLPGIFPACAPTASTIWI